MRKHQIPISNEHRNKMLEQFIVKLNDDQLDEMAMLVDTIVGFLDRISELDFNEENLVQISVMLAYMEFKRNDKLHS